MEIPRGRLSPEIATREEFPALLNYRGMRGLFVEVGVLRAEFAASFLARWSGPYVGIDPWEPFWEAPDSRVPDLKAAVSALHPFGERVRFERERDSHELADRLVAANGAPDLVYIDADHHYEPVKLDIAIWWPRVAPHGILAGHDYTGTHPGVVQAVNEFALENDLTVYFTHENEWQSWYIYRDQATVPLRHYQMHGFWINPAPVEPPPEATA